MRRRVCQPCRVSRQGRSRAGHNGQALIEYALLLAFIALVVNAGLGILGRNLNSAYTCVSNAIRDQTACSSGGSGGSSTAGKTLYAVYGDTTTPVVNVVDTASQKLTHTIGLGGGMALWPVTIAVTPDGSKAYVADQGFNSVTGASGGGNTVQVLNLLNNTIKTTITVGPGPRNLVVTPDGSKVYVANWGVNGVGTSVSVIRVADDTILTTIPMVDKGPYDLEVTPDGTKVYVMLSGRSTVSTDPGSVAIINTSNNSVAATVELGEDASPSYVAFTPDGTQAWVVASQSGIWGLPPIDVFNVATNALLTTITNPCLTGAYAEPMPLTFLPNGTKAYVPASSGNVCVFTVATRAFVKSITVDSWDLVASPDSSKVFLSDCITGGKASSTR
jgi:YVTN family beta-propeller protein